MNISRKQKQTHRYGEQTCGCWGRRVGREEWEFGINRGKLLYIRRINKVLLYSAGDCIQYPVINHNGKEYEKIYMNTCMTESLFCTAEIKYSIINPFYFNKLKKK